MQVLSIQLCHGSSDTNICDGLISGQKLRVPLHLVQLKGTVSVRHGKSVIGDEHLPRRNLTDSLQTALQTCLGSKLSCGSWLAAEGAMCNVSPIAKCCVSEAGNYGPEVMRERKSGAVWLRIDTPCTGF